MTTAVIDTSAYAAFKRGHPAVVDRLRRVSEVLVPAVVLGELLAGFQVGSKRDRNLAELQDFLSSPRVRVVPVDATTADRYAHIYAALRAAGRPIPTNDLWIAASAMQHGAEVLTLEDHFRHVAQIVVRLFAPIAPAK